MASNLLSSVLVITTIFLAVVHADELLCVANLSLPGAKPEEGQEGLWTLRSLEFVGFLNIKSEVFDKKKHDLEPPLLPPLIVNNRETNLAMTPTKKFWLRH
ncbi:hypothetical protein Hanom_Chr09g00823401 [Helianthus anomalus]